ncbi:MAG: NAD(P)-binding protein, partial [Bdellovibrionota bacterium]
MNAPKIPKAPTGSVDVLVAGAGAAGLLAAALELKAGKSVHLTEKTSQPGGRFSPELRDGFLLGSGFAFGDSAWWRAAADRLGLAVSTAPVSEGGALMHGPKGWTKAEDLPAWEAHLSEPSTEFPDRGLYGITESLLNYCAGYSNFSFSTEAPVTALQVEEGKVAAVTLGNGLELKPKEVFWCGDYKSLLDSFTGSAPPPGPERVHWMKKFVKTHPQPGVVLEFAHKGKLGDFTETLLVPFTADRKDDRRFIVGAIVSNRDSGLAPSGTSLSTWILPLSEEEWGDNHETMKKIRAGRRLIDKAFPNFEQTIQFERVLVLDSTVAPLGRKKGEWLPPLENLRIGSDWAMPMGATLPSVAEALLG